MRRFRRWRPRALIAVVSAAQAALAVAAFAATAQPSLAPIRGVVRALHQAAISVDQPMRVASIRFREADTFKLGQTLISFDCKRQQAEYDAALAATHEMQLTLQSQDYLRERGAAGKLDVDISQARLDKAEAEARGLQARLEQCTVVAPFDGRISELKINENEAATPGQPFVSLVDESAFEIDLIVPSEALRTLLPGAPFQFRIDETGIAYQGRIARIGAVVDPVSQTVKIIGALDGEDLHIIAGMSGSAIFQEMDAQK